jgi:hypothetical protein
LQKLDGWRANSNLEASDGGISDEYSDDDDPGAPINGRHFLQRAFISFMNPA